MERVTGSGLWTKDTALFSVTAAPAEGVHHIALLKALSGAPVQTWADGGTYTCAL